MSLFVESDVPMARRRRLGGVFSAAALVEPAEAELVEGERAHFARGGLEHRAQHPRAVGQGRRLLADHGRVVGADLVGAHGPVGQDRD